MGKMALGLSGSGGGLLLWLPAAGGVAGRRVLDGWLAAAAVGDGGVQAGQGGGEGTSKQLGPCWQGRPLPLATPTTAGREEGDEGKEGNCSESLLRRRLSWAEK